MSDPKVGRITSQQYIVYVDDPEQLPQGLAAGGLQQSERERALSTERRKVLTLTADEAERLKGQGIRVVPNRPMSIPEPGVLQRKQLTPAELSKKAGTSDHIVPIAIRAHGADKLQAEGIRGQGVTAVVIDTGMLPHPDLAKSRIKKFYDVFANGEVAPTDPHGHGSHVAGTIGASGKLVGMAPDTSFIGIKVLDDNGSGSDASVIKGIEQAMEYYKQGFRPMVVNMSLGGEAGALKDDPVVAAVKKAADMGIYFVIAAGNEGPWDSTIGSPGTTHHPRVITVAAFDTKKTDGVEDDAIAWFSSRGSEHPGQVFRGQNDKPDMGADGSDVISLGRGEGYVTMSGTSMATPADGGGLVELISLAHRMAAEGQLAVAPDSIDFAELLYASAYDHPDIPAIKEGRGELRVDVAARLLVERYGKQGTKGDSEYVSQFSLGGRRTGVDYAASIAKNRAAASAEWKQGKILDAAKDWIDAALYSIGQDL